MNNAGSGEIVLIIKWLLSIKLKELIFPRISIFSFKEQMLSYTILLFVSDKRIVLRLKYRYLDLRNKKVKDNIIEK